MEYQSLVLLKFFPNGLAKMAYASYSGEICRESQISEVLMGLIDSLIKLT